MEPMKFNYEFEFDLDFFVESVEDDYLDDDFGEDKEADKAWLRDRLESFVIDDNEIPSLIIYNEIINYNGRNYVQKIVDKVYEILKEKRMENRKKQKKRELMGHIQALKDYCNNQTCCECLLKNSCINDVTISGMEL